MGGAGGVKLHFDQNLSPRLPRMLTLEFPGSADVRELGLAREAATRLQRAHMPGVSAEGSSAE